MLRSDNIVTKEIIDGAPGLKGIGTVSTRGLYIDVAAATARKIAVVTSDPAELEGEGASPAVRGGVSLATADLTMGMVLGLAYRMVEADRFTRAGHFKQEQTLALMGVGCPGNTVGLIGLGKVARFMVPRIRAFDMHILYTKRTRLGPEEENALGIEWAASLDDLLQRSDFVCIECDYNPETHKLIGARELGLMKPTAYLINTARGGIVDEKALHEALVSRKLAGAGLDVFEQEPPPVGQPLHALPNVIMAPHVAGVTVEAVDRMSEQTARNILSALDGEPIRQNVINQDVL
jgi:D-3-phosphoglycerate dehydrogenase